MFSYNKFQNFWKPYCAVEHEKEMSTPTPKHSGNQGRREKVSIQIRSHFPEGTQEGASMHICISHLSHPPTSPSLVMTFEKGQ